jgi:hypothetical protein
MISAFSLISHFGQCHKTFYGRNLQVGQIS